MRGACEFRNENTGGYGRVGGDGNVFGTDSGDGVIAGWDLVPVWTEQLDASVLVNSEEAKLFGNLGVD